MSDNLASSSEIKPDVAVNEAGFDHILQIPVKIEIIIGSTIMPVTQLMKLGRGGVVVLDQHVGDPVDVVVNGRVLARGEIVIVEDETSRIGISLTEIVGTK